MSIVKYFILFFLGVGLVGLMAACQDTGGTPQPAIEGDKIVSLSSSFSTFTSKSNFNYTIEATYRGDATMVAHATHFTGEAGPGDYTYCDDSSSLNFDLALWAEMEQSISRRDLADQIARNSTAVNKSIVTITRADGRVFSVTGDDPVAQLYYQMVDKLLDSNKCYGWYIQAG
jgi:hypothetical protein